MDSSKYRASTASAPGPCWSAIWPLPATSRPKPWRRLRWAFGTLIGNTDMHAGKRSFIDRHGRPYPLAPGYDVLPTGFAPRAGGELVNTLPPHAIPAQTRYPSPP